MFFSVGTETQNYPGAQEYYGFYTDNRVCRLLGLVADLCCIPGAVSAVFLEDDSGFTQGRGELISGWNSPHRDMVWYGLCSEAMSGSIPKVQLSVSITLYLHPGSPLRMNSVEFIKRDFSLLRPAGNLERQKMYIQQEFDKAWQPVWEEQQGALCLEDLRELWLLPVWLWCWPKSVSTGQTCSAET